MKYTVHTYAEYLNLSLSDEEKITDNFDLYTDEEMSILDAFHSQFQIDLRNAKRENNQNKLVVENEDRLLTDDEFYNWPHWKILLFFRGKLNE